MAKAHAPKPASPPVRYHTNTRVSRGTAKAWRAAYADAYDRGPDARRAVVAE
jgi:hypothetical protein